MEKKASSATGRSTDGLAPKESKNSRRNRLSSVGGATGDSEYCSAPEGDGVRSPMPAP